MIPVILNGNRRDFNDYSDGLYVYADVWCR